METIPARIIRRMGYKTDSQGLIDRYIRMKDEWDSHLQNTRKFILKALIGHEIENLAVYGSGWCLDLPLEELSEMAGQVLLYDILHPSQTMHRARKFPNIKVIQADITGGTVLSAYRAVKNYKRNKEKVAPERICGHVFKPDIAVDYSISLNILSQIGEIITSYLKKYIPYEQEELHLIKYLLQQSHLQLLAASKSCLITDVRECSHHIDGQKIETTELIDCPLPASVHSMSWEWLFDNGEYEPGKITIFQIMALAL